MAQCAPKAREKRKEKGTRVDRDVTEDVRIIARAPNCRPERIPERKRAPLPGIEKGINPSKPVVKSSPL